MFFYTTSKKFKHTLNIFNLAAADNPQWLKQAAEWAENEWGYIRGFRGNEYREEVIRKLEDKFYIVTYANQPIGMFALLDFHHEKEIGSAKELMYFYVDENFRGLGIGKRMMGMVKEICNSLTQTGGLQHADRA